MIKHYLTLIINCMLLSFFLLSEQEPKTTHKPVIGIVTTPSDFKDLFDPAEYSYIKTSYAEFIQEGGGIPIVIPWDAQEDDFLTLLHSVNGVLFTGGDAELSIPDPKTGKLVLSNFTLRAKQIVDYAIDLHERGEVFPILGVCQGPQVVSMAISEDPNLFDGYDHKKTYDYLIFDDVGRGSRMFSYYPDHVFTFLEQNKASYFEHELGISPESLKKNPKLREVFNIISLAKDANSKVFIAALEGRQHPFYLVQYHPEIILQDYKDKGENERSKDSFQAIYNIARFFVDEAKKSSHVFAAEDDEVLKRFDYRNGERVYINQQWFDLHFYAKSDRDAEINSYLTIKPALASA